MVAKIRICGGMYTILKYNEKKLEKNEARCIYAGSYLKDPDKLSFTEKKARLDNLTILNGYAERKAVSLILQFAPGETLAKDDLIDISRDFMDQIGYGTQPYLVYRHDDTQQQHLHIVTTNIRYDGSRIGDHKIGTRLVQPARKAIEEKYDLVKGIPEALKSHKPEHKLQYGQQPTLQAMSETIKYVTENYRCRSLPELNAALNLYNIRAWPGRPGGRIHENRGLLYQLTNEMGEPVNAPVKASALPHKLTLAELEKHFETNRQLAPVSVNYSRYILDQAINEYPENPGEFRRLLHKNGLEAVATHDKQSQTTSLFLVDLLEKRVLTPTDLGPRYTPSAIATRLGFDPFAKTIPAPEKSLDRSPTLQPDLTQQHEIRPRPRR